MEPTRPAVAEAGPPAVALNPPATKQVRTPWRALVATAAGAAILASAATAGGVWVLTDHGGTSATARSEQASAVAQQATVVPVSSTATQPDWEAVAAAARPSVVAIEVNTASGSGEGSGVIIDAEGHIVTNDHVAGDARAMQVTLADGRVYDATLVGTDPTTDLAVIALTDPPDDLVPAVFGDSSAVVVGEPVMAVGNPLGLDSTVTTGIVSALNRPVSTGTTGSNDMVVTNAIQVDAAINPGNSGGPLFSASGQVIGITSSIASLSQMGGTAGSIGLGFAIPANLASRVEAELIQDGTAEHAFLGVSLSEGTATADGTTRLGAVVESVSAGSPAANADLRAGDVVIALNGQAVGGAESLTGFIRELPVGQQVVVQVVRDGGTIDVTVTLAAKQESTTGVAPVDPRG